MKSNGWEALAPRFSCYNNVTKITLLGHGVFSQAVWAEGMVPFAQQKWLS